MCFVSERVCTLSECWLDDVKDFRPVKSLILAAPKGLLLKTLWKSGGGGGGISSSSSSSSSHSSSSRHSSQSSSSSSTFVCELD